MKFEVDQEKKGNCFRFINDNGDYNVSVILVPY